MAVSKRTRYEVLRRDNHACRYCGSVAPDVKITVDHVTPVALGGTDTAENLVAACWDCNAGKTSTMPDEALVADVKQVDVKWAAAMKRAAEIKTAERAEAAEYLMGFHWQWCSPYEEGATTHPCHLPLDWEPTLRSLRDAGLSPVEMQDAVLIALGARYVDNRFGYFCGVAWNKVAALQAIAKALLAADEVSDS